MAYVRLGNYTTEQMVERLGITLTDDEISVMEEKRIDNAQHIPEGRWHCFDIPFTVQVGDYDTAHFIADILRKHECDMKTTIQIGIEKNKEEK